MADQSSSTKGVVLFLVCALILAGGLVASPFYLRSLQSPHRQLNQAVLEDVETVRYAILHVNPHLTALRDMRRPAGEPEEKPEAEFLARQDLMSKESMAPLSQTANLLRAVAENDVKLRGFSSSVASKIAQGAVNIAAAYNDLDSRLYAGQEKALKDAEAALNRLRGVSRGEASAANHLWVNRIQAILTESRAALHEQRGDIESAIAAHSLASAEALAEPLSRMRQSAAAILAQKPDEAMQTVASQLEANAAARDQVVAAISVLEEKTKTLAARIAELDRTAAEARLQMAQTSASVADSPASQKAYRQWSDAARQAEREAAALANGTLAGAVLTDQALFDALPVYQGGEPQPGLRDMTARLEELKETAALLDEARHSLSAQQDSLKKAADSLDAQKADVDAQVDALAATFDQWRTAARKHFAAAHQAREDAAKTYLAAAKAAKSAINDAQKITREAKAAAPADAAIEDACRRLGNDVDLEASMHILFADASARAAFVNAARLTDHALEASALARMAARTGRDTSAPPEDVDPLRAQAVAHVADALKAYEQAANLINRSSVKFTDGSASGKNYVWTVQVAQAALHMLAASLNADKPDEARVALDKAYALLSEATRSREQSPLLAPALDTLVYLQQSAR